MNAKSKLVFTLLLFSTFVAGAAGTDFTKNLRKAWTKSSVTALKITNKFGEVKINDTGGDSVTVKVVITIDNPSGNKAKELMDKIHIDLQKSGGMVTGETTIDEDFRNKQSFSINYLVNIPKDRDLDITNRYGNVVVDELEAKGNFDVSYGAMSAGKMEAPVGSTIKIVVNYGKANLQTINNADLEFKYSKLYADGIRQLLLNSRYSTANISKTENLTLDSKYDGINIDELGRMKSESKYTNYKIGKLTESFDLNTGYGSVKIGKVDPKFDKIIIINSYGGIDIGMSGLSYKLKADCDYCDLAYPENNFKGNKTRDTHTFSLDGNVGSGGGTVNISSRYGEVKLTE